MDYSLMYKTRELKRGDIFEVLFEANCRGALISFTPTRRGWKWSRMMIDLAENYEIHPHSKEEAA